MQKKRKTRKLNSKKALDKKKHQIESVAIALIISLFGYVGYRYIAPILPTNNLRFSGIFTPMETAYFFTPKGEQIFFCEDRRTLRFIIENIDDHEAVIQDILIEVISFEKFELQTDVYPDDVGDGEEYIYYILPVDMNAPSKAFMFDSEFFLNPNIKNTSELLKAAQEYSISHYEKLEKNETDYVNILLVDFPEDGYYTLKMHVTYTIGTRTKEKDIDIPTFLVITDESYESHVVHHKY